MSRTTAMDRAQENMGGAGSRSERSGEDHPGRSPVVDALPDAARVLVERPNQPTKNPTMRCPCGSKKPADMMVDVEAEGLGDVFTVPFVCTTCVKHARRQGKL